MKESYKEIYNFYKSHKICPWCRKNKSYKNYVKCLICLIEDRNFQKEKRRKLKMLKELIEGFEINIENFIKHNYENPGDGDVICPGSFGMKEIDISECNINSCRKCWGKAINDFKSNNNLR